MIESLLDAPHERSHLNFESGPTQPERRSSRGLMEYLEEICCREIMHQEYR